jgi:hypothetical protein
MSWLDFPRTTVIYGVILMTYLPLGLLWALLRLNGMDSPAILVALLVVGYPVARLCSRAVVNRRFAHANPRLGLISDPVQRTHERPPFNQPHVLLTEVIRPQGMLYVKVNRHGRSDVPAGTFHAGEGESWRVIRGAAATVMVCAGLSHVVLLGGAGTRDNRVASALTTARIEIRTDARPDVSILPM